VTIRVFQGEREMAADNKALGQFDLVGIPPAPRGVPQIEVGFDIDANGIVNVSAKDKGTGKEHQIRIQASGGLSDADIEKMVKDAEANAETDKKRREAVESKNQAEALIHSTEKSLKDYGDKVSAEDKQSIETALAELKTAAEGDDAEVIKAKTQTLAEVSMKLGQAMYEAAQAAEGEGEKTEAAKSHQLIQHFPSSLILIVSFPAGMLPETFESRERIGASASRGEPVRRGGFAEAAISSGPAAK
jgi:molecular chaperone DnaK